jgi:hypothetical protein
MHVCSGIYPDLGRGEVVGGESLPFGGSFFTTFMLIKKNRKWISRNLNNLTLLIQNQLFT